MVKTIEEMRVVTRKGIYYFLKYQDAASYASRRGYPTDRIIRYDLGWAIQLRVSGPYVGPATVLTIPGESTL